MQDVLVVDDDAGVRDFLSYALEHEGIPHRVAPGGREALAAIAERLPALILLDVYMPDMSGDELCEALRDDGLLQQLRIVLVTSAVNVMQHVRACAADGYLRKPFELDALYGVVHRFYQPQA
jgi:CheY-like chemotaxis protein